MANYKTIMPSMLRSLTACVSAKCTILISGGTGSGKTTTLNALSRFIPEEERIVQAMNTDVEGSMTTIHANTPRDAFSRLEAMMLMADLDIPSKVLLQQLASAIKMVVQVSRLSDGSRKILNISEVTGVEHGRVETQDIFHFERTGVRDDGKVQGRFKWSGVQPKMLERLRIMGIPLPEGVFDEVMEVNMD